MPQYQGVWTLEAQAQAQSNQQWVTDPNFKNTTLLLQADGTGSGSQNQTFLDGSTNNFFITRNGNTTQGSFSPFSQAPGYWSNFFNSTANYLTVPYNSNFLWSTGARTYEAWVYVTSVAANNAIFGLTNLSSSNTWELYINTSSQVVFRYFASGAQTVTTTGTVPLNTWAHIAFVYDGTSAITIYINGVSAGTGTKTGTPVTDSNQLCIGRTNVGTAGDVFFSGYISNVRFTTTTVYTSAFTPQTTPLTAITNTSLLTCQSNRFVDNSASPATITANGTVSVQAFGPFAPALQWTPDVVGGSGYFDGSGDSLTTSANANLAIGTSDFCIEWFYYQTSTQTSATPFCQWGGGVTDWILQYNSSNFIFYYASGSTSISFAYTPVPNQWTHGCVCRSGSTMSLYLNGVRVNTKTDSTSIPNTTGLTVGRNPDGGQDTTGYIAYPRLVVGSSVYNPSLTTLTVPTAPLTAVTGTKFLAGMTNAGIYDGKMGNVLETVGNAQVATSPVKYGSGSMYFDGSGDYLIGRSTDLLSFGTGDFTIEMWINPSSIPASDRVIMDTRSSGSDSGYTPYINGGTLKIYSSAADRITSTSTIAANVWSHIAFVRASGTLAIYINGVQSGTAAYTGSMTCPGRITIAAGFDNAANYSGFIDDFRVTKGVCRYIANFTPPQQALPRQ